MVMMMLDFKLGSENMSVKWSGVQLYRGVGLFVASKSNESDKGVGIYTQRNTHQKPMERSTLTLY